MAGPTLAQAEQALMSNMRAGKYLSILGIPVTGSSPVAGLADTISTALLACGVVPDSLTAPSDADVAKLSGRNWQKFLDIATFLVLEAAFTSSAAGGTEVRFVDYSVKKDVANLANVVRDRRAALLVHWGYGATTIETGVVHNGDCFGVGGQHPYGVNGPGGGYGNDYGYGNGSW